MRTRIIKIGNSQGIRIPKPLLEQLGAGEDVELTLEKGRIVIEPVHNPRAGWEEAFDAMSAAGDDILIDDVDAVVNDWDENEWQW